MEGANIVPVMDMNRNNNYGDCWGGGMWFMWIIVIFALMGGWGGNWNNRGNMGAEIFANGSMTRDQIADQQGITQKADWYYVMNMLYSDYSEIYGSDINMYIRVAKAYMRDPDAPEGKVFDLWLAQMEA